MSEAIDHIDHARAERERETYDKGLDRGALEHAFIHADYFYYRRAMSILRSTLSAKNGGRFLELGALCWSDWLDAQGVRPGRTICINISEKEIEKGVGASARTRIKPEFRLMDAHRLEFEANSFDVVFGGGILHHLDFAVALTEIKRVLAPGGIMVFSEPLDMNPVSRLVRKLTPDARTADERPLRMAELALCRSMFKMRFHYGELFSVPAGMVSQRLFSNPDNVLTRSAFYVDEALKWLVPALGPLYRHVIIVGEKQDA